MGDSLLEIGGLVKEYPGVRALDGVDLSVSKGSVHCIVGENGAGKSTFIKILTGAVRRDAGSMRIDGRDYTPRNVKDAVRVGISTLFQELNVVDQLSVEQNLTLGMEVAPFGVVREGLSSRTAVAALRALDPDISPKASVSRLSFAQKQVIEIAKAVAANSRIIVMDEPTASLSEEEVSRLFAAIRELKRAGVTVLYISHRLDEIFAIGDFVTVLRDGRVIDTLPVSRIASKAELIRLMIGRTVEYARHQCRAGCDEKVLEARGISTARIANVTFELHRGEILGFYGLVGSGKTEIARALYGADRIIGGSLVVGGRPLAPTRPRDALRRGIAMVPEERRIEGLLTRLSIRENISIMNPRKISRFGITRQGREREIAKGYMERLSIVSDSIEKTVALLSGGNQQKVVVSKCLNADSRILLLDEPTRGVDVGAKQEIHSIIHGLSREGVSIIVFSSEMPEILDLCDRIALMHEGRIRSVVENGPDLDGERMFHIVSGGE